MSSSRASATGSPSTWTDSSSPDPAVPGRSRGPAVRAAIACRFDRRPSFGKLADVLARLEPLLTSRRAVDLCRTAGCCCRCSC
ncbi:putative leader peptide [Mycobacterium sp. SMC-2]|uniref:putative leader peptide n=1 Tax=Mycobacterium sp. SMC-2 TaxID=2857058 RepID=UPI0037CB77DC